MSTPPSLKLKPNAKARVLHGHPWVFANEVESLADPTHDGELLECRDRAGRLLGVGLYNSRSQIIWRRLSRERVSLDEAHLRTTLQRALARRADAPHARLVWSESDELPGLVVDRFADLLVVQTLTLAMDRRADLILEILHSLLAPSDIILRNDASIRRLEGLPLEVRTRSGQPCPPHWVNIAGIDYWLDLQNGQKTGFYLDQREQHLRVAAHCAGKSVLDTFCNQGPFALQAARAGASRVLGLDSAHDAISQANRNAARNQLTASFESANVFDWFNAPARTHDAPWDVIILDPPPFAKSKSALPGALRGYKELNLRALKSLAPGGLLATYTCSHHMQDAELRTVIAEAASDARRRVQILEFAHQPPDHPVLVTMPESEYLRGYLLRVE